MVLERLTAAVKWFRGVEIISTEFTFAQFSEEKRSHI